LIGKQLGAYAIQAELGAGGMGKVYLAEVVKAAAGLEPGTRIALKVVHPHLLETPGFFKRFLQEAELGKRVRHENVVRTFDVDAIAHESQQHHYMVMEYVEGKSLRALLHDLHTIPETLLREVAVQTVAGLAAIHAASASPSCRKPRSRLPGRGSSRGRCSTRRRSSSRTKRSARPPISIHSASCSTSWRRGGIRFGATPPRR
jgi:serine/threonine-protein kinase